MTAIVVGCVLYGDLVGMFLRRDADEAHRVPGIAVEDPSALGTMIEDPAARALPI